MSSTQGNLPVLDKSDGTVGSIVPTVSTQVGGSDGTNLRTLSTDATGKLKVNLNDGSGSGSITSDNNGNANNQRLHVATPDTTTTSTALGALNATISISMSSLQSVGLQLSSGTLIGTLVVECSLDGGLTYPGIGSFYDPSNSTTATSITFSSANGAKTVTILPIGGSSHIRIRVSAYTSGTANALLRASQVNGAAGAVTAAAFGTVNNTFPVLTANSATLILSSNPNRKYAYIANSTGTSCNIQFNSGTGLSTTTGLQIPAKSFYELKGDNLYTGNIYAFASSGISLSVTEGTP